MKELVVTPLGTVAPFAYGKNNCPGYLVKYGKRKILLDCGNGITSLMDFPEDLQNLEIFVSHFHPDHFGDLMSIAQAALVYSRFGYVKENIKVHLPEDNGYIFKYFQSLSREYPIEVIPYRSINKDYSDMKIETMTTKHDIPTSAFKISASAGTLVYSADTGNIDKLVEFAGGADLFICEATFLRGQQRVEDHHLYAYEAGRIAKLAKVRKLLLTHFWPEIDKQLYVEEAKEYFENTEAAEEGKKIVLRR